MSISDLFRTAINLPQPINWRILSQTEIIRVREYIRRNNKKVIKKISQWKLIFKSYKININLQLPYPYNLAFPTKEQTIIYKVSMQTLPLSSFQIRVRLPFMFIMKVWLLFSLHEWRHKEPSPWQYRLCRLEPPFSEKYTRDKIWITRDVVKLTRFNIF